MGNPLTTVTFCCCFLFRLFPCSSVRVPPTGHSLSRIVTLQEFPTGCNSQRIIPPWASSWGTVLQEKTAIAWVTHNKLQHGNLLHRGPLGCRGTTCTTTVLSMYLQENIHSGIWNNTSSHSFFPHFVLFLSYFFYLLSYSCLLLKFIIMEALSASSESALEPSGTDSV